MDRSQKQELVAGMRDRLSQASTVIIVRQTGLTVDEVTKLRRQVRDTGAEFKVLKNTLALRAVQGTTLEALSAFFEGPTAIAFSQDPVGVSKVIAKFADQTDKFTIVGACLNGQVLSANDVKSLAKLPSLDELRAKLLGLLMTPATRIAQYSREPAAMLARVIGAHSSSEV
jgi:large subunit ribosomal protein L10